MIRRDIIAGLVVSLILHGIIWAGTSSQHAGVELKQGREAVFLTLQPSMPAHEDSTPIPDKADSSEVVSEQTLEDVLPESSEAEEPVASADSGTVREQEELQDIPAETMDDSTEPAPEQNASLAEQGVETEAFIAGSVSPEYPFLSRRRGEEGKVTLEVEVMPDGSPGEIRLKVSSGYERLDRSAKDAMKEAGFEPATRAGVPIRSTHKWTFTFRLED